MTGEVSDEQMAKCFGKHRSCDRNCRLKEVCLDAFREKEEDRRRHQFRETAYIDEMDADAPHVSPDFVSGGNVPGGETEEEILAAIEQLDLSDECRTALRQLVGRKTDEADTKLALLDMLRKLGEVYVCDPVGFEVLFFQVLAGGSQAALAKARGCTKQNVNKSMARGKIRLEAYRQMAAQYPECRLSPRELAVFHAVELEGMTYRQAAEIVGCSRETIRRVCQNLRLKGVKCAKKHPGRKKGNKKGNGPKSRGGLKVVPQKNAPGE